ncbi:MAG TPA: WYL domain-containing protein [Actinomycetes bacterium]|jgi:proteasome accessory factor C
MTPGATERLSRLLALVPYLVSRQGIPLSEAAAEFDITEAQLVKDLELLFVCGTPGHLPDDLIDVDWDDGTVYLSNADPIARPLRLAVDEALALLVGLRALADVPGLHDREVLERTLLKLEAAAGEAAAPSTQVRVEVEARGPLAEVRRALETGRRVHLTYFVPARDETTERDVDPMRVLLVDGRWYLEGWCRRAEDVRLFRLDRVDALTVLDLPAEVPAAAAERDLSEGLFRPTPDDTLVTLELAPPAHWVADYYPVEDVVEVGDDLLLVRLRVADDAWLRQLALRLGGALRVLDPAALADEVASAARMALEAYVRT